MMTRTLGLALLLALACSKKGAGPKDNPAPAADAAAAVRPADAAAAPAAADAAPAAADAAPAANADAAPAGGPDAGKTAGNTGPMRDLQVLPKSWSRDKVDQWMEDNVERGLGVECEHCHEKDDYGAPHKKKTVAREMMRMTAELDRTYFKSKRRITCFTCHLGKEKPPGTR